MIGADSVIWTAVIDIRNALSLTSLKLFPYLKRAKTLIERSAGLDCTLPSGNRAELLSDES